MKHSRTRWNPWPISIAAFFALAIGACGVFVAFCNWHPADLIAADYYEQEMRYQGEIERRQNAQLHAPDAFVTYDSATRLLTVALPPSHAQSGLSGTIRLYRPSALDRDREIQLAPGPAGQQAVDASSLLPGLWKIRVSWTVDHREYLIDRQVVIGAGS